MKAFKDFQSLLKQASKADIQLHPFNRAQMKQNILAALDASTTETVSPVVRYTVHERRITVMRYILASVFGLLLVSGTAYAAQDTVPGDPLYGFKRAQEKLELHLVFSDDAQAKLQIQLAQKRLEELASVEAQGSTQKTEQQNDEAEAQVQAHAEVSHAIDALTTVKAKLEAKGNTKAAAAVGETLVRLQNHTTDSDDQNEVQGEVHGASTTKGSSTTHKIEMDSSAGGRIEQEIHTNSNTQVRIEINNHSNTK